MIRSVVTVESPTAAQRGKSLRSLLMPPATVTIVVYHRISLPDNPDLAPALIDAYPADFEAQMRYLATHYRVVSGWDLVRALREGLRIAEVPSFESERVHGIGRQTRRDPPIPVGDAVRFSGQRSGSICKRDFRRHRLGARELQSGGAARL